MYTVTLNQERYTIIENDVRVNSTESYDAALDSFIQLKGQRAGCVQLLKDGSVIKESNLTSVNPGFCWASEY